MPGFPKGVVADTTMVEYISAEGLSITGNTAVATAEGEYTVVAKYTDYAGKIKYGMVNIVVE